MSDTMPPNTSGVDDHLPLHTSYISPGPAPIPTIEAPEHILAVDQLEGPSLASTLKLPDQSKQYLSPPLPEVKTPHVFSLADVVDDNGEIGTQDIVAGEINVAADGKFIETSSGAIAHKLKRRYDQLAGVGPTVRSPYAITAFVNQHGKSMYRLGHRDEISAPAASAVEVEERITQSKTSSEASCSPRAKRRSRLSIHFLQPNMFKSSIPPPPPPSRPPPGPSSNASGSKKLRKTRSIPDMSTAEPIITTAPTFAVTGRGHSQSVTAVDNPRPVPFNVSPPPRQTDAFGELMDWLAPPSSVSTTYPNHDFSHSETVTPDHRRSRATIANPFGHNVTFNSPSVVNPIPDRLLTPRHLREMQSFESGLTARQDNPHESLHSDSPAPSSDTDQGPSRPASALRMSGFSDSDVSQTSDDINSIPEPESEPEPEASSQAEPYRLSSHYSIEVFNVLQTYRGLPLFEKLVPEIESSNVIKLSLAADQSAAPRDDPRFVLWGEVQTEQDADDFNSRSRNSLTDVSGSNPSSSSMSRRRSSRVSKFRTSETDVSRPQETKKILLAATIERWIAQLTSDLNYDELLNFFLTYRTYVSAVDLCHLFICRFHWALQEGSSKQDETVRRIVRVRTFVAIRYWLLTFFTVDFIPNRELRLLIADWLNALIEDPILKRHPDATDIVKRLIKVAKECKRAHTRASDKPKTPKQEDRPSDHLLGPSFAEAIRKLPHPETESILDLDFFPDEAKEDSATVFQSDPANAHLIVGRAGSVLSPTKPTSLPLSSLNILQRTDHAPGPSTDADPPFVQNNGPVIHDHRHSALSRAFVRTIGRLGRWKRVLNHRTVRPTTTLGACGVGDQAFDLELAVSKDLLTVNGGVEQYLKMIEPVVARPTPPSINVEPYSRDSALIVLPPLPSVPTIPSVPIIPSSISQSPVEPYPSQPLSTTSVTQPDVNPDTAIDSAATADAQPSSSPIISHVENGDESSAMHDEAIETDSIISDRLSPAPFVHGTQGMRDPYRPESFMTSSTESFGALLTADGPHPLTFPGQHNQWHDPVIDDLDFSDTGSLAGDNNVPPPPGLFRPARKLPLRRDFEFVRRSEVSSFGIINQESLRDSLRDSVASSNHSEGSPSASGLAGPIHKWQMKSIQRAFESTSNDGEDTGDVEAALRKLEGQINPKILQEQAEKVDGWVRSMQERMKNGDYEYESSLFSEDEVEGFIDEVDPPMDYTDPESPPDLVVSSSETDDSYDYEDGDGMPRTPIPTQTSHNIPLPPGLDQVPNPENSKPAAVDDAVPVEILRSRLTPNEIDAATPSIESVSLTKFSTSDPPRAFHQSFILHYPAEQLAQHFSMIDRELFIGIKFEELVTEEWSECQEINVLDWAQYLKDRAQWKAESRFLEKTTALAAVRARFNLMVSFVIAEIVLTPPGARHFVVNKFIRIAWKCYSLSNFNSLTAIITALKSDWVSRAMKRQGWARVGPFESRMFKDLKQFITVTDDFKFMRQVIDSIVDSKPLEGTSHAASVISGGDSLSGKGKASSDNRPQVPTACIPFIGIYLSQLHTLNKLPAMIDPTAPNSLISVHPVTAIFDPPSHPEVFSSLAPLPPSMHLEPLINVHKQRCIADVIKALVAGQHLASRVQFTIDKRLFQKCLRLRGLEASYLQRALAMYPD